METYSNQDDGLRDFLAENGKAIVLGLIIGIGAVLIWHFWQKHQTGQMQAVSDQYQTISKNLAEGNMTPDMPEFAKENANVYGAFTAMALAKQAIDNKDYGKAISWLTTAAKQTNDNNLQDLVRLRLARVQLQDKQADAALATLDLVKDPSWLTVANSIRGDAWLIKGDVQKARAAYQSGLAGDAPPALFSLIKMKLNDLAG